VNENVRTIFLLLCCCGGHVDRMCGLK
jgi:hypothetical protein